MRPCARHFTNTPNPHISKRPPKKAAKNYSRPPKNRAEQFSEQLLRVRLFFAWNREDMRKDHVQSRTHKKREEHHVAHTLNISVRAKKQNSNTI